MKHLLEILKIVEGAANADPRKVSAYVDQLASKLDTEGDPGAAEKLRKAFAGGRTTRMELASARPAPRLPVDSESRLALADERTYRSDETNVVLDDTVRDAVTEFLRNAREADKLIARGVDITPSALIYGPPGCGKTELAKYIAAQLELPLLTARTDSLISSFLGSTAKNLRLLFEHAMGRPCVLFLDEFDAVAKLRDDRHELGELKRVVVSLLQNIDALDGRTILLAATNHEHLLDPAIWRRFAYRIQVAAPGLAARTELFRRFLNGFVGLDDTELFAVVSEGMTGADIREIADRTKRDAILSGADGVPPAIVLRRVLQRQFVEKGNEVDLPTQLRRARAAYPKVLTYRLLAEIFEISTGHVSNLLRAEG